jgi:hypothetical protein
VNIYFPTKMKQHESELATDVSGYMTTLGNATLS